MLESGDSMPGRFIGVGIASRGVDGVTISGGAIRGYRYGLRREGGRHQRELLATADASAATAR